MATQFQETEASFHGPTLTFADLAEKLNSLDSVPSLGELYELIERTQIGADEVQPYLGFKAGNY